MRIFEVASWPTRISADDLIDDLLDWHHSPEDFEEGDLIERIEQHPSYALKLLPLRTIDLDEFLVRDDLVAAYKEKYDRGESPPPIVYDTKHRSIIDGIHRANAAAKAGHSEILAYVPAEY